MEDAAELCPDVCVFVAAAVHHCFGDWVHQAQEALLALFAAQPQLLFVDEAGPDLAQPDDVTEVVEVLAVPLQDTDEVSGKIRI